MRLKKLWRVIWTPRDELPARENPVWFSRGGFTAIILIPGGLITMLAYRDGESVAICLMSVAFGVFSWWFARETGS